MPSNASFFSDHQEDKKTSDKEIKEKKKRKTKFRHRFTAEQLQTLKAEFMQSPYPDYETREKLAKQFHCERFIIYTWFQNKRARLAPEERRKLYLMWNKEKTPVPQDCQTRAPTPNYTKMQSFSCPQESLLSRAACSYQQMQPKSPIANQTSLGFHQHYAENRTSSTYFFPSNIPVMGVQCLTPLEQNCDRNGGEAGASIRASQSLCPFLSYCAHWTQMRRQEGQQHSVGHSHPQQPLHPHYHQEITREHHQEQQQMHPAQYTSKLWPPWSSSQWQPQQSYYTQAAAEPLAPPYWQLSTQDNTSLWPQLQTPHQHDTNLQQPHQAPLQNNMHLLLQ